MAVFRQGQRWAIRMLARAVLVTILAGCDYLPGSTPFPTITPDATIRAVPRMLTLTAAAPTITVTPLRSATPTLTATVTPTITPYPGSAQVPGSTGEKLPLGAGGTIFTVLSASAPAQIPNQRAIEGTSFVELDLLIENHGSQAQEYNRLSFRLVPQGGDPMEPLASAGTGPMLLSGTLRPGEWARGRAAFRVPEGASGLRLRWQGLPSEREMWALVEVGTASAESLVPATGSANGSDDLPVPGQRVSRSGISLSIDQVLAGDAAFRRRARTGYRFVTLSVTISNEDRDRSPFNAEYFRAKDEAGYEYAPVVLPSDELVGAGSLARGRRMSGKVVFELPGEARSVVVKYRPQVLVEPYEEIRVRLTLD